VCAGDGYQKPVHVQVTSRPCWGGRPCIAALSRAGPPCTNTEPCLQKLSGAANFALPQALKEYGLSTYCCPDAFRNLTEHHNDS